MLPTSSGCCVSIISSPSTSSCPRPVLMAHLIQSCMISWQMIHTSASSIPSLDSTAAPGPLSPGHLSPDFLSSWAGFCSDLEESAFVFFVDSSDLQDWISVFSSESNFTIFSLLIFFTGSSGDDSWEGKEYFPFYTCTCITKIYWLSLWKI